MSTVMGVSRHVLKETDFFKQINSPDPTKEIVGISIDLLYSDNTLEHYRTCDNITDAQKALNQLYFIN